jgi:glycosyltransferase involved in cell wall biosynthesis
MNKYFPGKYEFIYFAETDTNIQTDLSLIVTRDLEEAAVKAWELTCSIFIFRPNHDAETTRFLRKIDEKGLKAIAWMHNNNRLILNKLSDNKSITACVCPGRDQYETMRDHPLVNKLVVINNAIDHYIIQDVQLKKEKSVVFLGSLSFAKGFHTIAKMWKKILRYHPDARLIVIGSGNLYDTGVHLGSLNLAEKSYEKLFHKYILNDNGGILDSICFMGKLGNEKFELMRTASVGIVTNPLIRETFCLAAVEFQLCGTPVVGRPYGGLNDTVENNKGGYLRNSSKGRLRCILQLLADPELSKQMGNKGNDYVKNKFNYQIICNAWNDLFIKVLNGPDIKIIPPNVNYSGPFNMTRELLRLLKTKYRLLRFIIPSIYVFHLFEFLQLRIQKFKYWLGSYFP